MKSTSRKFLSKIIAFILCCTMLPNFAAAANTEPDTYDVEKEQIAATMEAVFEYLNTQTLSLSKLENQVHYLSVGDETVKISINNEQISKERKVGLDGYDIVSGKSYVYTLTIDNIYNLSGKVIFKIYYDVGKPAGTDDLSSTVYRITLTDATISATAPSGFSKGDSDTYIDSSQDNSTTGEATAYIEFTRTLLSDITVDISVSCGTVPNERIMFKYSYEIG